MTGRTGFGAALRSLISQFDRYGLALALLTGLLLRVIVITLMHGWDAVPFTHDDATYVRFARSLIETGRLDTAHFPVGYTLFITPLLMLGSGAFVFIRIAQVLLSLLTIVFVSRSAAQLFGSRAGLVAAFITALYPPLIFMTGRIMSETLFITILMASLYLFLLGDREQSLKKIALAAALFGLASIVRSNLILMVPFIPLWILMRFGTDFKWRLVTATVATAAVGTVLMLPGLYFLETKGEFIPFSTNGGQTFYGANNSLADGDWVEPEDHPELLASIPPEVRRSPAALSKAEFRLGVKWIRENPLTFLSLLPKKFANAWIPGFQRSETTGASSLASVVLALSYGSLLVCAIAGRMLVKPAGRDAIVLAILVTYTVMILAFFGGPRYNLIISPILILYAAALLSRRSLAELSPWLARWLRRRKLKMEQAKADSLTRPV